MGPNPPSKSTTPPPTAALDNANPREQLTAALIAFINAAYEDIVPGAPLTPWPVTRITSADFTAMARRVLCYQAAHNRPYALYAERLGVDLAALDDPLAAPPIPTDAFKHARLSTFDAAETTACFRSSGTTREQRSSHQFRTLAVMRAAIAAPFLRYVLADRQRMRMLVLAPTHQQMPESSLYFMLSEVCARFTAPGQRTHFFTAAGQLDAAALWAALDCAAAQGEPVLLLGPSLAYVHFLASDPDRGVALPPGSRLFETGGFKGLRRATSRTALHAQLAARLGLDPAMIVGEYGMSELSSQLYEGCVRHRLAGHQAPVRYYIPPPWCAVRILDPETLAPLPPGEEGLVSLFDLANLDSVAAVVTGDLGYLLGRSEAGTAGPPLGWHGLPADTCGLVLRGRAPDAAAKGCSLALDMLLDQ